MKDQPSDMFIAAILRGFDAEQAAGNVVTPASIWSRICMGAIMQPGAFTALFEWDTRKTRQNRIGTIIETIQAGHVPGLKLAEDGRGRTIVRRREA